MIDNNKDKYKLTMQIETDSHYLENIKESYCKKKELYERYLEDESLQKAEDEIKGRLKIFEVQIEKINKTLEMLKELSENNDSNYLFKNKMIKKYNGKYEQINDNFIRNSMIEDDIALNMETLKNTVQEWNQEESNTSIKSNDTLLISETLNKVILPYTAEEVERILANEENYFQTAEEVINNLFTRPMSDYKFQFISRYKETMKLATEREKYSLADAITLSMEMMGKRYLHPAIISACRSLDELDVYLDCLDKNELEDFQIFQIKYELHPLVIKNNNTSIFQMIKNFFNKEEQNQN